MTTYKLIAGFDGILRLNDNGGNTTIPVGGSGWAEYQAWLAENTPEAADPIPPDEIGPMQQGAKAWFVANPATQQLFTLTIPELETEINTLIDALFPAATAQNRTKAKKFWMALAVSVRVLVKREFS